MKRVLSNIAALLLLISMSSFAQKPTISLDGNWGFKADPKDNGVAEKWFLKSLYDTMLSDKFNPRKMSASKWLRMFL